MLGLRRLAVAAPAAVQSVRRCLHVSSVVFDTGSKKKHFDISDDPLNPLKKRDDHPYVTGGAKYMPGFSFPAPRELSAIVKLPLLERESPEEIKNIWMTFHEHRRDSVATVIDAGSFQGFRERSAKKYV
jgi:ATP11 protein